MAIVTRRAIWALVLYIAAFALFVRLRALAVLAGFPVHFWYPIAVDRALFAGHDPTPWLQSRLGQTSHVGVFDSILVAIYVTYFFVPHLLALVLWLRRDRHFLTYCLALYGTLYLGLIGNLVVPTAPPWLAARDGFLPPIVRPVPIAINGLISGSFTTGNRMAGSNDVAAMPSLHLAAICVVAFMLATYGRLGTVIGFFYTLAMAFALVYLGEHYVSDEVAGLLLAAAVWWAVQRTGWRRPKPKHGSQAAEPG